jgi:glutathione S-transferase
MKLHAHKISTTSRPVLLFIAENDIPCEIVTVDLLSGAHHQEPFISLNPNRQVPVLEDDGFVLTESSAILKYLADRIDSPAYPKDLHRRTRVNELMDWFNTGLYREYGYHLLYPQVFPHHARQPEDANRVTIEWGRDQSAHWLGVLDKHWLGSNAYVCGKEITIADYMGAGYITAGELIRVNLAAYPNILGWLDRMRGLRQWDAVFDVFNGFVGSLQDKPFITIA